VFLCREISIFAKFGNAKIRESAVRKKIAPILSIKKKRVKNQSKLNMQKILRNPKK